MLSPLVHSTAVLDDCRAEYEKRIEQLSLRARARRLNQIARSILFSAAFTYYAITNGPPSDFGDDPAVPSAVGSALFFSCLVIGASVGGCFLDRYGWAGAVCGSSALLVMANVVNIASLAARGSLICRLVDDDDELTADGCTSASSAFLPPNAPSAPPPPPSAPYTATAPTLTLGCIALVLGGLGVGSTLPLAGVLALAREKGSSRTQSRLGKTWLMHVCGVTSAVFVSEGSTMSNLQPQLLPSLVALPIAILPVWTASRALHDFSDLESSSAEVLVFSPGMVRTRQQVAKLCHAPNLVTLAAVGVPWLLFSVVFFGTGAYHTDVVVPVQVMGIARRVRWMGLLNAFAQLPGALLGLVALRRWGGRRLQLVSCTALALLYGCSLSLRASGCGSTLPRTDAALRLVIFTLMQGGPRLSTFVNAANDAPYFAPGTFTGLAAAAGHVGILLDIGIIASPTWQSVHPAVRQTASDVMACALLLVVAVVTRVHAQHAHCSALAPLGAHAPAEGGRARAAPRARYNPAELSSLQRLARSDFHIEPGRTRSPMPRVAWGWRGSRCCLRPWLCARGPPPLLRAPCSLHPPCTSARAYVSSSPPRSAAGRGPWRGLARPCAAGPIRRAAGGGEAARTS